MGPPPPGLVPGVRRKRGSIATATALCRVPLHAQVIRRARRRSYPLSVAYETVLSCRCSSLAFRAKCEGPSCPFWRCSSCSADAVAGTTATTPRRRPSRPSRASPCSASAATRSRPGRRSASRSSRRRTRRASAARIPSRTRRASPRPSSPRARRTRGRRPWCSSTRTTGARGSRPSQLMAPPLRAPILLTEGADLPEATADALDKLQPTGSKEAGDAQVIRIGDVAEPDDLKSTDVAGGQPVGGRAADRPAAHRRGRQSFAQRARGLGRPAGLRDARGGVGGEVGRSRCCGPDATSCRRRRGRRSRRTSGRGSTCSARRRSSPSAVTTELRKLGSVKRISGPDPVTNAIAFARFSDGRFGWGVSDPGHGLVFASARRTLDAAAGAPLSASGQYGPLLLLSEAGGAPPGLAGLPARHPARLRR